MVTTQEVWNVYQRLNFVSPNEKWYTAAIKQLENRSQELCELDYQLYNTVGYQNDNDERIGNGDINSVRKLLLKFGEKKSSPFIHFGDYFFEFSKLFAKTKKWPMCTEIVNYLNAEVIVLSFFSKGNFLN